MLRLRKLFEPSPSHFDPPVDIRSRVINPDVALRPFTIQDEERWNELKSTNREWLAQWTASDPVDSTPMTFTQWIAALDDDARSGTSLSLAVTLRGLIVGEISLGALSYGSLRSGMVGYWIDKSHAGRGLIPLAVAILADWAFSATNGPHLHRIEIALLPVNGNSRRVVEKLGFVREGLRRRYMHVASQWRDHEVWSLLADEVVGSVEDRLRK